MTDDLISRQAAIEAIEKYCAGLPIAGEALYMDLEGIISTLPSAEPERKKGEWVWLSSTYDRIPCEMRFECSECHHETIVHTSGTSYPWEHYCPNCGAEMRRGDES